LGALGFENFWTPKVSSAFDLLVLSRSQHRDSNAQFTALSSLLRNRVLSHPAVSVEPAAKMHAVRRAALRAASSSTSSLTAASVSRQQRASLAMLLTQATARPATMPVSRFFSQTSRRANEEREIVEEATKAAEEGGSTSDSLNSLENASQPRRSPQDDGHTLFVSNMSFDATDMHLREAFGKYGDITAVNIGRDGRGLSRGFGFITFSTQAAAQRALEECDKSFWHGRRINVQHRHAREQVSRPARSTTPSEPSTSLYVGNIPYETSDADLNRLFRDLENITDVRVAVDRNTGWPRGFAHADFADLESAIKAHGAISQMTLGGRNLRVDYSQKRTTYNNNNNNRNQGREQEQ
jgi:nucleolin